jgi:hypothetical protein
MRITYKLSQDDLIEAQGKHGGVWAKAAPVFGLFLILAGVGAIALNPKQNIGAISPILVGLFLLFGLRLSIRRSFRQNQRLQQEFEAVVSQNGIDISSPTCSSKYAWSAFTRYVESRNLFLVYQAPKVFNVFPKRAFAPGEEDSFRSLLSERLGTTSLSHRTRISPQTWVSLAVVAIAGILLVLVIHNVR